MQNGIYNGDGLRLKKVAGSTTTLYAWDVASGLPLVLLDGPSGSQASYIYGPGGLPIELITSGGTAYWVHHDQLGSTRALTDNTGTVQATWTYDAYGAVTSSSGSVTMPLQYAGQYTDSESGLQYLRARYYDPTTGQFLTQDPMAAATRSPYGYASYDPVDGTDPSGLDDCGWNVYCTMSNAWNQMCGYTGWSAEVRQQGRVLSRSIRLGTACTG
jgi:RHS repeat-associated protein